MEIVARFEIGYTRYISPAGSVVNEPLPAFAQDSRALILLYRAMIRTRAFDAKALALQRTGRLGTCASSLGQEAVGVGVAAAMRPEDVLLPSFREQGAMLWRGVTPLELFQYWGGDERGSVFAGPRGDFPICVPVAGHALHAAGVGLAFKLRGEPRVAVCILGDGGTSKGDFSEALNIAGVWRLPVLFVINNNQWAISVPRRAQTAAETLAQKAIAAGVPAEQVDGNDVVAVQDATERALRLARAGGGGASVIEALTYRLGDHTTADDARRYRDDSEVSARWPEEPIARLRHHLMTTRTWSKTDEEHALLECAAEIDKASEAYASLPGQPASSMFDHLFATLPKPLEAERAALLAEAGADD